MSVLSVITDKNLETNFVLDNFFKKASLDLLKKMRFDFGCIDYDKVEEMLFLDHFVCSNLCYITDENEIKIREEIIKSAILTIEDI